MSCSAYQSWHARLCESGGTAHFSKFKLGGQYVPILCTYFLAVTALAETDMPDEVETRPAMVASIVSKAFPPLGN
jgi:hypothetical protein